MRGPHFPDGDLTLKACGMTSRSKEVMMMNRNSLLIEGLKSPPVRPERSVWAMTMAVIGTAFGARSRETGR